MSHTVGEPARLQQVLLHRGLGVEEIGACLGRTYVEDERSARYDDAVAPGLAQHLSTAPQADAQRRQA
ncbi:MAG: hypothetical protein JWQ53_2681 [Klenkia sp.]|nr:hypothetical protein [Klenkia sp.]